MAKGIFDPLQLVNLTGASTQLSVDGYGGGICFTGKFRKLITFLFCISFLGELYMTTHD